MPCTAPVTRRPRNGWPTGRSSKLPSPTSWSTCTWTLAQCRMLAGMSAESLATLDRALAATGISARHRARLLVLGARTHSVVGEVGKAGRVATSALAAAEADDNWAMGWALHVLTLVTTVQGDMTDALPLFGQALAVTQAEPALTDLRLLLQINQAVTLAAWTSTNEPSPGPGKPGASPARSARASGWLKRTAPWASCCSKQEAGTTRWPKWRSCPRTCRHPLWPAAISALPRSSVAIVARSTPRVGTWPLLSLTTSGSDTGSSASWPWRAAWTASKPARCPGRWPR